MDLTPPCPDSDQDWTTVNFPGALSLEALVEDGADDGADSAMDHLADQGDRMEAGVNPSSEMVAPPITHPTSTNPAATGPARSGTDVLQPYWSGNRPARSPAELPFQREEPNHGGSRLRGSRLNDAALSGSRLGDSRLRGDRSSGGLPAGPTDVAQLVAVAETLNQENEQLRQQVARLETAVAECRATLDLQQMRAQTQQALYDARSRDFESTKQEATRLAEALAAAQTQLAQQDQERAEWVQQEACDRGRIAQLERACALLQEQCLKQADELMQLQGRQQDLQERLKRQQRQTLQLRTALEQCLEQEYGRSVLPPLNETEPRSLAHPAALTQSEPSSGDLTDDQCDLTDHQEDQWVDQDWVDGDWADGDWAATATLPQAPEPPAERPADPIDAIRTEEILALLNWDLEQTAPNLSYQIRQRAQLAAIDQVTADRALANQAQDITPKALPPIESNGAAAEWESLPDAVTTDDLAGLDRDGLDDLADALWLSDWPRPLSPTEQSDVLARLMALAETEQADLPSPVSPMPAPAPRRSIQLPLTESHHSGSPRSLADLGTIEAESAQLDRPARPLIDLYPIDSRSPDFDPLSEPDRSDRSDRSRQPDSLESIDLVDLEPIDGEDLATPLAEVLSLEAELMDWPARSTPVATSEPLPQWPAPTLAKPRKRRDSLAAVELPKF
ncbi:hypothetical protein H6F46_12195 [Limnothrix sp. FACHB-1083]|uniref:hypothetical protein n=1 Tax=unclassified Limnothrix TaxID=2632864 RepID=UPI001681505A|nr:MULTISPECIES: hypothetical protein [unclassified Limnothrix]MBD2161451.1 hypothetical protein [Limnothrix sp. FACHB-1083]MBD2192038.1 hypothetical protein [Limnothrix sp. FACHB-1088]